MSIFPPPNSRLSLYGVSRVFGRVAFVAACLCAFSGFEAYGKAANISKDGIRYRTDANNTECYVYSLANGGKYVGDIVIPSSIVSSTYGELPVVGVYQSAFSDCVDLTSVTLPESVTAIGNYAFDTCEKLKTVVMPGVKQIGHWTFRNCYELENLTFSDKLEWIGNFCFDKNHAQTIVDLPASITQLYGFIWEGCPNLTTFICRATTPPPVKKGELDGEEIYTIFDDNNYHYVNDVYVGRKLYVPDEAVADYRTAGGWNQFYPEIYPLSEYSGVEDVVADAGAVSEIKVVGKGAIAVTATEATRIVIVNIAGELLKDMNVAAGTTTVSGLPSGILLVNGKKVAL